MILVVQQRLTSNSLQRPCKSALKNFGAASLVGLNDQLLGQAFSVETSFRFNSSTNIILQDSFSMLASYMFAVLVLGLTYVLVVNRWVRQRAIPGPLIGRWTTYYRVWLLMWGDAPRRYAELHRKYGPIVQTGPYHVSISESRWIPVVYDSKHQFRKVNTCRFKCARGFAAQIHRFLPDARL